MYAQYTAIHLHVGHFQEVCAENSQVLGKARKLLLCPELHGVVVCGYLVPSDVPPHARAIVTYADLCWYGHAVVLLGLLLLRGLVQILLVRLPLLRDL